jgi:hypothetical protein
MPLASGEPRVAISVTRSVGLVIMALRARDGGSPRSPIRCRILTQASAGRCRIYPDSAFRTLRPGIAAALELAARSSHA